MSFTAKLVLLLATAAVVPVTIFGVFSVVISRNEVASRVEEIQTQTAVMAAEAIDGFLKDVARALQLTTQLIPFDELGVDELHEVVHKSFLQFDFVNIAVLLDKHGQHLVSPVKQAHPTKPLDWGGREPVTEKDLKAFIRQIPLEAILQSGLAFGSVYHAPSSNTPRVAVGMTTSTDAEKAKSLLVFEVSLQKLQSKLMGYCMSRQMNGFVVDATGRVVYQKRAAKETLGDNLAVVDKDIVRRGLERQQPVRMRYYGSHGEPIWGAYAPIKTLGWGLVIEQLEHEALASAYRIQLHTVFWAVLCVLLGSVAGVLVARGISQPIQALVEASKQVAAGNYGQKVSAAASDEFGGLSNAFNKMSEAILRAFETIENQNHEIKDRELLYRVLVETSPDGIFQADFDGTITSANRRMAGFWGYEQNQLLGQNVFRLLFAEESQEMERQIKTGLLNENTGHFDCRLVGADGSVVLGEINVSAVHDPGGKPSGFIGVVRDVTERKHMQTRMAQSDRMASVGMLAAGVAHEINNPLTFVISNLENLRSEMPMYTKILRACSRIQVDDEAEKKIIDIFEADRQLLHEDRIDDLYHQIQETYEGANRVRDIVRSLKTFSRIENKQRIAIDLNQLFKAAANMAYNEIKYRARLAMRLSELSPVLANESEISQVFLNLIVNAAQSIEEGHVDKNWIELSTWMDDEKVYAKIEDSGSGIAKEHLDRIFEPFFTTKEYGMGLGLGLSICHNMVSTNGGNIEVKSELGKGTRFVLSFPKGPKQLLSGRKDAYAKQPRLRHEAGGRILIVDDEPYVLSAMQRELRDEYQTETASSGLEAKELLSKDSDFDVIICDLLMPEVTGMELFHWLSERAPVLSERMVFITGGAAVPQVKHFLRTIKNPCIDKPFDAHRMRMLIQTVLKSALLD